MTIFFLPFEAECLTIIVPDFDATVMSFNLRYGLANDGENSWEHRKQIVIECIKNQDPDIMGVQEALLFQAEYLDSQLPEYERFGVDRDVNGKGELSAIYYKKELFDILEAGNFWLSKTPDIPATKSWNSSLNRMATWGKFRHRKTGVTFFLFNTHFDHRSKLARAEAAKVVLKKIDKIAGTYPVVLCGDFNAIAETSEPWKNLNKGGMEDAWLKADNRKGPEQTFHGFKGHKEGAKKKRIDWIMGRGELEFKSCVTLDWKKEGKYPSDHYPIVTKLNISGI